MSGLDDRLRESRTRLLDEIDQPDLTRIADRAVRLRRRRVAGRTGVAMLALVAIGILAARPLIADRTAPPVAATPAPEPSGVVYADAGITVNGLVPERRVVELPGSILDVEFADPDHGWVLTGDCPGGHCALTVGSTADGGQTWQSRALALDAPADLVALDASTVLVHAPARSLLSADGGLSWRLVEPAAHPVAALGKTDRPLLRTPTAAGARPGGVVEVWSADGYRGDLAVQPSFAPTWIAPVPAADGGWWVGGAVSGVPAVAVTRDLGRSWQRYELPGAVGDRAEVAMLGGDVFATTVAGSGQLASLHGIYRSTAGGPFLRTWTAARQPTTIGGQPVPLLDGRLLLTNGLAGTDDLASWYVSADGGVTFAATRTLPKAGALRRTLRGYVAVDIVADGWVAYSSDGATWRKLHVH